MTDLVQRLRIAGDTWTLATQAADRIEALERENAELRKDAERYRFIRKADQTMVLKLAHYAFDALDAAIDEAMKS